MKVYAVVHNGRGPYHLFDCDKGLTCCNILAPGCHSRNDDATLTEDGLLFNTSHGAWWPENIKWFCKKCLKNASVNTEITQSQFIKKFSNERSTDNIS